MAVAPFARSRRRSLCGCIQERRNGPLSRFRSVGGLELSIRYVDPLYPTMQSSRVLADAVAGTALPPTETDTAAVPLGWAWGRCRQRAATRAPLADGRCRARRDTAAPCAGRHRHRPRPPPRRGGAVVRLPAGAAVAPTRDRRGGGTIGRGAVWGRGGCGGEAVGRRLALGGRRPLGWLGRRGRAVGRTAALTQAVAAARQKRLAVVRRRLSGALRGWLRVGLALAAAGLDAAVGRAAACRVLVLPLAAAAVGS